MKTLFLSLIAFAVLPSLVHAQSVDILWSGTSYTPPFYEGGSSWSQEGSLVLVAIPQGLGNSSNLIYKWIKNGTVLGSLSGVGQDTLSSQDPLFSKSQRIEVQIIDQDDNILAQNAVNIVPTAPQILIYEKHPLYGFLFNREASGGYVLDAQEATFAAFPLFFSAQNREGGSVSYVWKSGVGEDSTQSTVTYRIPEGAEGSSQVSLKAVNPDTVRQTAAKSFLVQFGNEK